MIGRTLSHYKVLEKIGEGGMGEVYLAKDTKLDREVAVKVLPATFSENKERLARFEREARLLASLNHPNIAAIHELEESDGVHFLALEYVPGETLAERIKRGRIPIDEALPLFKQIAEGLEAAHEKGVIHRDLKPANIKVTPEGKVKVLDFGLAKAMAGEKPAQGLSESPTITREHTEAGVLLGTAPYMSPEQARGKAVDKRTDIWAFGCCLYEALTGKAAYLGDTVTDTIAKIVEREPDWEQLPSVTSASIQRLLRRCLQKEPSRRLHDMADVRIEIDEAPAELTIPSIAASEKTKSKKWKNAIPWSIAFLALAVAIWQGSRFTPNADSPIVRFEIATRPLETAGGNPSLAFSPDGRQLVYVAETDGIRQLYLRNMDSLQELPIPGTDGAIGPFFSPDSQWVGFFTDGMIKKVPISGGAPVKICDVAPAPYRGASWGSNDSIIFTPSITSGLREVPASGGNPKVLTVPDSSKGEYNHRWPDILPGNQAVLFTIKANDISTFDDARIAALSLQTGRWQILIEGGTYARYVATGYLVYVREGSMLAVPFDPDRLEVLGTPTEILQGLYSSPGTGYAQLALSRNGSLVYGSGDMSSFYNDKLLWVNRHGETEALTNIRRSWRSPRLSPDGQSLAVIITSANNNIWVYSIPRETLTRVTYAWENSEPLWTPDGQRVSFRSSRSEQHMILWKAADGSGEAEVLTASEHMLHPNSWSPDGKVLAYTREDPTTLADVWLLVLDDERGSVPLIRSPFNESQAQFSPDGNWLAYVSDESGQPEVYVRAFPGPGARMRISTDGGDQPVWSDSSRELFYRNGERMMTVPVTTEPEFTAGKPRLLFEGTYVHGTVYGSVAAGQEVPNYDVSSTGQRFVMVQGEEVSTHTQINVVLNWLEELKRLVPTN